MQPLEQAKAVETLQSQYTVLPDYAKRARPMGQISTDNAAVSAGWTSFAGVVGSLITMAVIWGIALGLRRKGPNPE